MSAALVLVAVAATLIVSAYLYVQWAYSYWKRRGIPYIQPVFPFGNFSLSFSKKMSLTQETTKLYNETSEPFIGIFTTLQPALLIRDPKIIKDVHIKNFQSFNHRGFQVNVDVDPMADNILFQQGEKWRNVRTQLSPAFSSGKMKAMFDVIANCTVSMHKYVDSFADTQQSVEVRDVFARYATNVIVSVAFGIDIDCIKNRDDEFREKGTRIFLPTLTNMIRNTIPVMAPRLAKLFGVRFADKDVGEFMIATVRKNLEYRESSSVSRKDFFQMLMQLRNTGRIDESDQWTTSESGSNKKAISLEEMSAHAFLFFAGGYESSSSTMSFLMYELAKNPKIQEEAYEDIMKALKKHDGKLTYDSVADMKFVEQCLNESLRLHPPFGVSGRKCTAKYNIPDTDITIEEGTLLFFATEGLQTDPKYYKEPYKFKPERYSEDGKSSFLEMPNLTFGEGPRNCLGMRLGKLQSKVAIISLLQKYRFELADEHKNGELKLHPFAAVKLPSRHL
ncbi:putative cytochrome P450 6d5 [Pseudolycoriella hygida]|uniref:Cytochrome P450 6d5 n=1 Tax=Pseudolycoriella hygida TaxID=35572 RepID=A0A9Q0S5J1_9DIPT|nr:putative cytochrome P450 6d5 [Pseudolycoriella hygida]